MSAGIQNGVPAEGTGVAAKKPDPAGSSKSKLQPLAVGIKGRSAMSGIGTEQRCSVSSYLIIIDAVLPKNSPKVLFAEHDQMISALMPYRPDQSFQIPILPGRAERDRPVPDAHGSHPSLARHAKNQRRIQSTASEWPWRPRWAERIRTSRWRFVHLTEIPAELARRPLTLWVPFSGS